MSQGRAGEKRTCHQQGGRQDYGGNTMHPAP
jgi:hypothetical protein